MSEGIVLVGEAAQAFVTFKYVELFTDAVLVVAVCIAVGFLVKYLIKEAL